MSAEGTDTQSPTAGFLDLLRARIDELEKALGDALDIAEWEASEYRGKRETWKRLPQLRALLARKEHASR